LERKESRGAHSRIDFPDKDKEWGGFTVVLKRGSGGGMEVRRDPLPPVREDLQKIIEEQG
jgi:succinate dehydrogenase / fumarate reductase flavoprotein subunit